MGSRQASVTGTPKPTSQVENRPPSSVASTPKPTSGFNDISSQMNSDRMQSSGTTSRIPTAADRFPKGLPNNAPVILVIGAPGSHKSEIADKIAHKYDGFVHLSMGDLLRNKVQQNLGDELWSRVGKKMELGEQIPMKICRDILYSTIHDMGSNSWGYVIEGYPRTIAQAEDIESQLGRLDIAVLIDCTEAFCKDNIRKRFDENREKGGTDRPGLINNLATHNHFRR
jgi:adenylate kinase family enzyme